MEPIWFILKARMTSLSKLKSVWLGCALLINFVYVKKKCTEVGASFLIHLSWSYELCSSWDRQLLEVSVWSLFVRVDLGLSNTCLSRWMSHRSSNNCLPKFQTIALNLNSIHKPSILTLLLCSSFLLSLFSSQLFRLYKICKIIVDFFIWAIWT